MAGGARRVVSLVNCDHGMLAEASPEAPIPLVTTARLADEHLRLVHRARVGAPLDPYRVTAPMASPCRASRFCPTPKFERSVIYNEVIRPTGTFHAIFAQQRGPTDFFLNLCRSKERPSTSAETATVQRLLRISPPRSNSAAAFACAENGHSGLAHLLDRLAGGVILTDARRASLASPIGALSCSPRKATASASTRMASPARPPERRASSAMRSL